MLRSPIRRTAATVLGVAKFDLLARLVALFGTLATTPAAATAPAARRTLLLLAIFAARAALRRLALRRRLRSDGVLGLRLARFSIARLARFLPGRLFLLPLTIAIRTGLTIAASALLAARGPLFATVAAAGLGGGTFLLRPFLGVAGEQSLQPGPDAAGLPANRGRSRRRDDANGRLFDGLRLLCILRRFGQRVGLRQRVADSRILGQLSLVVTHAPNVVVRRFERRVGDEYYLHVVVRLEALHPVALLVEEIGRDFDR